jgi:sugar lactone lactonase YvrE
MKRMRMLLVAAALGLGLLAVPTAAPTVLAAPRLPDVLTPAATNQFPEGVAWDPSRQALLTGSFSQPARITATGRDGVARTVVSDPELPGFAGMKVDARRHRILAVYGNPATPGPSGLASYDLATGHRTRLVDLSGLLGGAANDVALDQHGTAYVTDLQAGAVYRVDPAGHASTLVQDPRLLPAIGANGIVWHPGGFLVVVNYTTGRLFRIDPRHPADLTEVRTPRPLIGGDGLGLRPDGTLIVVTNPLSALPGSRPAVHELALVAGGRVAVPLRDRAWPDPAPTTVAVTPFGDYVLYGRLDQFLAGRPADDFVLRRI